MFGLFLTGTVLSFVLIFVMPISVFTRWLALPVAILAFLNALFVTVASVVAPSCSSSSATLSAVWQS